VTDVVVKRSNLAMKYCKSYIESLNTVDNKSKEEIFKQGLIKAFIDYMWENHFYKQIIYYFVIPFLIQLVLLTVMFMYFLDTQYADGTELSTLRVICKSILAAVNLLFCFYFLVEEWKQMKNLGLDYLDFWNSANCLQILLTVITIIACFFEAVDPEIVHTMAAISLLTIYLNLFYMARMQDELAWFNILFQKTILDLRAMLIMYLLCILTFGTSTSVLNQSRIIED